MKQFKLGTDGVRGTDKHLFSSGLSHMLSASIREQKYWLRTIQLSRAFIVEREKKYVCWYAKYYVAMGKTTRLNIEYIVVLK